jgi:hypothetical protein
VAVGVGDQRAESLQGRAVVPHVAGRYEEAGVVGRLKQDLDPPRIFVGAVVLLDVALRRRDEPEARPQRARG